MRYHHALGFRRRAGGEQYVGNRLVVGSHGLGRRAGVVRENSRKVAFIGLVGDTGFAEKAETSALLAGGGHRDSQGYAVERGCRCKPTEDVLVRHNGPGLCGLGQRGEFDCRGVRIENGDRGAGELRCIEHGQQSPLVPRRYQDPLARQALRHKEAAESADIAFEVSIGVFNRTEQISAAAVLGEAIQDRGAQSRHMPQVSTMRPGAREVMDRPMVIWLTMGVLTRRRYQSRKAAAARGLRARTSCPPSETWLPHSGRWHCLPVADPVVDA